ncbi:MAG TPA: hypothetical protein VF334_05255, partial [Polyangia bacterium]
VGDSSYVLYLLQLPLIEWMVLIARRDYHHLDAPFAAAAIALILAISMAVHFLVETRAQTWLRPHLLRLVSRMPRVPLVEPKRALVAQSSV